MDGLGGTKKRFSKKTVDVESSSTERSNGKERKKKNRKSEKKSVKDHMDSGNNEVGSDEDVTLDGLNDTENNKAAMAVPNDAAVVENDIVMEAENKAKEALLKSDSSSSDGNILDRGMFSVRVMLVLLICNE